MTVSLPNCLNECKDVPIKVNTHMHLYVTDFNAYKIISFYNSDILFHSELSVGVGTVGTVGRMHELKGTPPFLIDSISLLSATNHLFPSLIFLLADIG